MSSKLRISLLLVLLLSFMFVANMLGAIIRDHQE